MMLPNVPHTSAEHSQGAVATTDLKHTEQWWNDWLGQRGDRVQLFVKARPGGHNLLGQYDAMEPLLRDVEQYSPVSQGIFAQINPFQFSYWRDPVNTLVGYRDLGVRSNYVIDADVLRRCYFYLDIDVQRDDHGHPASKEEQRRALQVADEVNQHLVTLGFPEAAIFSSGNGAQLHFTADLANDQDTKELLDRLFAGVAERYPYTGVAIDTKVSNPSRMFRVPGSMNRKGTETEDRPFRAARFLTLSTSPSVVTIDLLRHACEQLSQSSSSVGDGASNDNERLADTEMAIWLRNHDLPLKSIRALRHGAVAYNLSRCLFNPEHTSASVIVLANGTPKFRCPHDGKSGCANHTWKDVLAKVGVPDPFPPRPASKNRAAVNVSRQLREVSDDCKALLEQHNDPPILFRRGRGIGLLSTDPIRILDVRQDLLGHTLGQHADFFRETDDGHAPTYVSPRALADLLARPDWKLPELAGITPVPIIREDGTVLTEPGYDAPTQLFYSPAAEMVIPEIPVNPTSDQVRAARQLLDEVFVDFCVDSPASRANAMALLITAVVRKCVSGCVPAAVIDANKPGAGKGLLVDVISILVTGLEAPKNTVPSTDEEMRKQLTSLLAAGATFVVLDNLKSLVDFASLDAFLTAPVWRDRKLRTNDVIELPNPSMMVLTGNNVKLGTDMARRSYLIRLRTNVSRPWERSGYLHPDLKAWIRKNRGNLVAALLTICAGWHAAGQPRSTRVTMGSFEDWAAVVGGVIEYIGVAGFLENRRDLEDSSMEAEREWHDFLTVIGDEFGHRRPFTVNELIDKLNLGEPTVSNVVRDALPAQFKHVIRDAKDALKVNAMIGRAFGYRESTPFGETGIYIERLDKKATGSRTRWLVGDLTAGQSKSSV